MGQVIFTPRAEADLDAIWLHVAMDAPRAADRLIERILEHCGKLMTYPRLGASWPEVAPDARMLTLADYLILYRVCDPDVGVVRIVHGARYLADIFDAVDVEQ